MSAGRKKIARATKARRPKPRSGGFTVDERDAISAATERAKAMLTLVMGTLNEQDVSIFDGLSEDPDRTGAVLTACDIIREALDAIDFHRRAADERQDVAIAARKMTPATLAPDGPP